MLESTRHHIIYLNSFIYPRFTVATLIQMVYFQNLLEAP